MTDVTQKRQQVTYTVFLQGSVSTYILCVLFLEEPSWKNFKRPWKFTASRKVTWPMTLRTMWWYQSSKTAKIIWVTLDGAMHMASLQADFSW